MHKAYYSTSNTLFTTYSIEIARHSPQESAYPLTYIRDLRVGLVWFHVSPPSSVWRGSIYYTKASMMLVNL